MKCVFLLFWKKPNKTKKNISFRIIYEVAPLMPIYRFLFRLKQNFQNFNM